MSIVRTKKNHRNQPTTSDGLEGIVSQKDIPATLHDNEDYQTRNLRTSPDHTLEKN